MPCYSAKPDASVEAWNKDSRMLELRPMSLKQANGVVAKWHSHHKPVIGHKFSVGVFDQEECEGCVIVSRPVAQALDDGVTFEVTRLCTNGRKNAASMLLGSAWRASRAMGVRRLVSYTREDEHGTSYKAAGWLVAGKVKGRPWVTGNKVQRWLPGLYTPSTEIVDRVRWEISRQ